MEQEPMEREPMEREAMEREPMEQETMEQEPMVQTDPVAFTVKLTAKDLWKFSLYHSNKGMLGHLSAGYHLGVQHGDVPGAACYLRADVHCVAAVSPVSEGGQAV